MSDDEVTVASVQALVDELWNGLSPFHKPSVDPPLGVAIIGTHWHIEVESMAQARRDLASKIAEIKREREGKRGRR